MTAAKTTGIVRIETADLAVTARALEGTAVDAIAVTPDGSTLFALVRDGKYNDAIKPLTRTVALGGADGKVFGFLGFASSVGVRMPLLEAVTEVNDVLGALVTAELDDFDGDDRLIRLHEAAGGSAQAVAGSPGTH